MSRRTEHPFGSGWGGLGTALLAALVVGLAVFAPGFVGDWDGDSWSGAVAVVTAMTSVIIGFYTYETQRLREVSSQQLQVASDALDLARKAERRADSSAAALFGLHQYSLRRQIEGWMGRGRHLPVKERLWFWCQDALMKGTLHAQIEQAQSHLLVMVSNSHILQADKVEELHMTAGNFSVAWAGLTALPMLVATPTKKEPLGAVDPRIATLLDKVSEYLEKTRDALRGDTALLVDHLARV